jgi:hypothetical protein
MSMPEAPAVPADQLIADLERVRAGTYLGRDRAGLVSVAVDGDGLIVKVAFAGTVGRYDPRVVERAVRIAVAAARCRLSEAFGALSVRAAAVPDQPLPDGVLTDLTTREER